MQRIFTIVFSLWKRYFLELREYHGNPLRGFYCPSYWRYLHLEGTPNSEVTPEMLSKEVEAVEEAEKMGIRIEWFYRVIGRILKVKEHQKFAQKVDYYKGRIEVLQRQLEALA